MFSFLRPLITVVSLAAIHVGAVVWCTLGNWNYLMGAAAEGIEGEPGTYQRWLDLLYFPTAWFPGSIREQLGTIDFATFSLSIGFISWMLLGSALAFLKKPEKGSSRSFIPPVSFGKLLCLALFGLLIFGWVTQRLLPLM